MLATQVLHEDLREEVDNDDGDTVGVLLIDDERYVIPKGETKIGRDPSLCAVVIDNFTVSKVHAVVESEGIDDTFIYDVNSTNQTKLGKKVLKPHCRYKLDNDSMLTFGNVAAKFILPPKINNSSGFQSNLENFNTTELEDIFEIATQVSAQPCPSGKVLQVEKASENIQIFKVPKTVELPKAVTEPSESAKPQEVHTDSKPVSKTQCCDNVFEASAVFSLDTQCQIISSTENKNNCENKTPSGSECDKLNCLLDDGQDDVLHTFMSQNSPSGTTLDAEPEKIKTEVVEEEVTQIFNMETQAQVLNSSEDENIKHLNLNEDFSCQNLMKQSISSTPLNKKPKSNSSSIVHEKSDNIEQAEEDIVKTQEFKSDLGSASGGIKSRDAVTAPEESDIECYLQETIDFSADDIITDNEDFICTQKFETSNKNSDNTDKVIENEESNQNREDFLETQIYEVNRESSDKVSKLVENREDFETQNYDVSKDLEKDFELDDFCETQIFELEKEKDQTASLVGEKDNTCEEQSNPSQKDLEEDFICTQAFAVENYCGSPEKNDEDSCNDDEDFIATQPVDVLGSQSTKELCGESRTDVPTSREGSPDILNSEKISEDKAENAKCKSSNPTLSEFSEQIDSMFSVNVKRELDKDDFPPMKIAETQSSGDETESDLEIVYDKNVTLKKTLRTEEFSKESRGDSQPAECSAREVEENDESNSSYVFQLEEKETDKTVDSDSDATDCEEIAVVNHKISIKQEPVTSTFEDTQVLTLSPPSDFVQVSNHFVASPESPKFDVGDGDQVSSTESQAVASKRVHDTENQTRCEEYETPLKIKKTEVGETHDCGKSVDSPLKRRGNSYSGVEPVPVKKLKTEASDRKLRSCEKQFLKIWQAHNIEQIQPNRTRNSLKNCTEPKDTSSGSVSNKRQTSRERRKRKTSGKRYLSNKTPAESGKTSKETKTELINTSDRVLRSSRSGSDSSEPPTRRAVARRPRRNSRFKNDDYFNGSSVNVVFTGFDSAALEQIVTGLGGKRTNDLASGDVVVAEKVRRTVKFLCAIGLRLPITSPEWLVSSKAEKKFLNPWRFLLKDEESEEKWDFQLKSSLERSMKAKLMQGLNVFATENAKPPAKELSVIVESCGGTPLIDPPAVWPKKTVIVSCEEDSESWPPAKLRNVKIVHYEFILSGVLRQKLDYNTYKLR